MIKKIFTLLCLCTLCMGSAWGDYVKITSTAELTDGQYLIVYTSGNVALDGSLTTIDVSSNTVPVTVNNFKIVSSDKIEAAAFTFSASNGAFLGTNGLYITHTGSKNTLDTSTTPVEHSISFSDGNVALSVGSYTLKYNKTSGQTRFRYYTSGQEAIQLYKKESSSNILKVTYDGNGSTGGSTEASHHTYDREAPLSPNGFTKYGYTFSGWATSANGSVMYTDEQTVKNLVSDANGSITLYAKWTANTYTVTYYNSNGSVYGSAFENVEYGSEIPVPEDMVDEMNTGYNPDFEYNTERSQIINEEVERLKAQSELERARLYEKKRHELALLKARQETDAKKRVELKRLEREKHLAQKKLQAELAIKEREAALREKALKDQRLALFKAKEDARRIALKRLKKIEKAKEITEDEAKKAQDTIQKTTDKLMKDVDAVGAAKEKEVMEI